MISERTLKQWRREALEVKERREKDRVSDPLALKDVHAHWVDKIQGRILRMTQELLDLHLLQKVKK